MKKYVRVWRSTPILTQRLAPLTCIPYCDLFKKYAAPPEGIKASARHILVNSKEEANMVLEQFSGGGATFSSLAKDFSTCPSGKQGGSLGSFSPGTMVKEFDEVIFNPETELGQIVGPVQTKFGFHIIVVDKRTGV
jgi:peptidyl-prolyl cis-trans isomerase C